jgi:cytochrome bd-type quinol oxidase subunit 2
MLKVAYAKNKKEKKRNREQNCFGLKFSSFIIILILSTLLQKEMEGLYIHASGLMS